MITSPGIALLRGINVGRAKRIAMADLRLLFEELGFSDVRTVLNSGNVVFGGLGHKGAAAAAAEIEAALVQRLGVASRVTVLSAQELAAVMDGNPLVGQSTDHARLVVFMLSGAEQCKLLDDLLEQDWSPGALAVGERAAYVWCPDGMLDSAAASAVAKLLGDGTTSRNWNTLCKLLAICRQAGKTPTK
ncbi:MAG: hypothetical protein JWP34_2127 [Massilia sp.]|jgi:uncharacterized protein (DUF1697 family)|nr:hypothetical protein [Massilia sp.]